MIRIQDDVSIRNLKRFGYHRSRRSEKMLITITNYMANSMTRKKYRYYITCHKFARIRSPFENIRTPFSLDNRIFIKMS